MAMKIKTAALYARFSSDLQKDRSIDDQLALCRTYCEKNGIPVAGEYVDRARSGASVLGRDGLERLMQDARSGLFTVVLVEALDRLSRDQEDLAGIWKRLRFLGVEVVAVHEGTADAIQIGVRGLVGALFLSDLAHKVRRGQTGVVREGRHAGGKAYGYKPVPGKPGELAIDDSEAAVVRRIFAEYVAGSTPRVIAGRLNSEGVPPPRGARWNASTINGNMARGHGILLNDIYAGRLVWNRVRMVKDPDTGKRISRPNPESEWLVTDVPHLRIVDQETFDAARARKLDRTHMAPAKRQKPRHLLSGLLRCGACGSGMRVHDKNHGRVRIICSRYAESRSCSNTRRYYLDNIQATVIAGLADKMQDPEGLAEYVRVYNEEMRRLSASARKQRDKTERRLGEVTRQLERIVDAIAEGAVKVSTIAARLNDLETEKERLQADLAASDDDDRVVSLHPGLVQQYQRDIQAVAAGLTAAFNDGDTRAVEAFRRLVESVTINPAKAGEPVHILVKGRLSQLLGHDVFPTARVCGEAGGSGGGT
ncbi:recombinase family protein [Rhodoligotrophos ferricapiens]|uniref:recombinase family protein n=1 Tax=Rhodoligotrophos ferricapiens TaxID=3069264 RepID=UPI00315D4B2D